MGRLRLAGNVVQTSSMACKILDNLKDSTAAATSREIIQLHLQLLLCNFFAYSIRHAALDAGNLPPLNETRPAYSHLVLSIMRGSGSLISAFQG